MWGVVTYAWPRYLPLTHKSSNKGKLGTELSSCNSPAYICSLPKFYHVMTSPNWNILRVTGHLCGEVTGHRWVPRTRPVTRSFDVFFDLNKRLNKQLKCWWFETLSHPLWRHCNDAWTFLCRDWSRPSQTSNRNLRRHDSGAAYYHG